MRKIMNIIVVIGFISLIPFTGCRKIADHISHSDNSVVSNCRIVKIFMRSDFSDDVRTGIVYYNDHNDPDSVIFDFEGSSAGVALFYFSYDDHHRLIEYRADYSREPDDYYFKHTYAYDYGIIVRDTTRGHIAGQWTEIDSILYDSKGRIVKITRHIIEVDHNPADEEADPFLFNYDAFGNVDGETFVYDNKVNFLRTNKVWMFTQRDYSMNNRPGVTSYNQYGLPLAFNDDQAPYFLVYGVISLEYECLAK